MLKISKRYNLVARLAAALLLTSSMTAAPIAARAATTNPAGTPEWAAFFKTGYGWCDAQVLSQYWKMNTDEAKVNAGAKILNGGNRYLGEALAAAYHSHACGSSFNYEDAAKLAELWTAEATA